MRILFFTRLFYPHIGGVEKHVYEISKRLIKDGHLVTIITENHSWAKYESLDGIKIYRVNVGNIEFFKKFRIWWWLVNHLHIISQAEIVHCHDIFIWYLPFALLFPMKNTYTTFHGYEGNNAPGFKAKLMHKVAEFMSNKNICVGAFLEKWYGTKASIITYGATKKFKIKEIRFKRNNPLSIIYLGRLEQEAGIMQYIKAIKILKDKRIKTSLRVLGDGSQRKACEEYVKKNNLDVSFLGFVKKPEMYIQNAGIVFVSRYLGILEALAAKKPVIAIYNNPIKKDYLTMTPFANFIWTDKNASGIAKSINVIVKGNTTSIKKIGGYNWAKKQSWEKLILDYKILWNIK